MRLDVYQAKVNAEKNIKASGEWDKLSPEEKRLVEKMVRSHLGWAHITMLTIIGPRFLKVHGMAWHCQRKRGMN